MVYFLAMSITPLLQNGLALLRDGNPAAARKLLEKAVALVPENGDAQFMLGLACEATGDSEAALDAYRKALDHTPNNAEAALSLGLLERAVGNLAAAAKALQLATQLLPEAPAPLNALAIVLLEMGRPEQASELHTQAFRLAGGASPEDAAAALDGLGNCALAMGRFPDAIAAYRQSLNLQPEAAQTWSNLAVAHKNAGELEQAFQAYDRALQITPGDPATLCNLANAWQAYGDMEHCRECFSQALTVAQQDTAAWLQALWGSTFARLSIVHSDEQSMLAERTAYEQALARLETALPAAKKEALQAVSPVVGANQPFYLTYQGLNDRPLQKRYGVLAHRVMAARHPEFATPLTASAPKERIRVGIVCGFMHEHSVWKIPTKGWTKALDRERFEVFGYSTGVKQDHCSEDARRSFDVLRHEPHDFEAICRAIRDDRVDALLFPEVGMDPTTARLAALRLAPVQAVSLGHPMTTGLPTMDYFLSSELMEPDNAQDWYSEELVPLPNLGVCYSPLRDHGQSMSPSDFGLPEKGRVLFFCPQTLPKYLPQYDFVFAEIAARVPESLFVFLADAHMLAANNMLHQRIAREFTARGLDPEHFLALLPHQGREGYLNLNHICDIFLDSIGWSGFNTAMEAATCGLPIISCPTGGMRGRHTQAVLRMLGHEDCLASNLPEYVAMAVRLVSDATARQALRQRTLENRHRLFDDLEAIRGLERFIEQAVEKPAS